MGYASKLGRARISSRNPQAAAQCDRCGLIYNHVNLKWQFDWAGASLINKRILVCDTCYDTPQQQLRSIIVPADPVAIKNPRTTDYVAAETNYRVTSVNPYNVWVNEQGQVSYWANVQGQKIAWTGSFVGAAPYIDPVTGLTIQTPDFFVTQNNDNRVTQQTGEPPGGLNQLPGTDWNVPAVIYDGTEIGLPYNNDSVPFTGPLAPPYNYVVQWNNQWNFGILTGSYWSNNINAYVKWTTTTL